jgi:periplasmic copper chaperone A
VTIAHRRPATIAALTGAFGMLAVGPAAAHVTANPSATTAGGYAVVDMRVPHGCDGEATEVLEVQIPDGVVSVKPEQVAGWDVTTEIGPYDEPVELHGQEVTEGVRVVTWTAQGDPLPDDQFRNFGISLQWPDAADETLVFPAVQTCVDGAEEAWIETSDDADASLDYPAPTITLMAGDGDDGHGHADDDDHADEDAPATEDADQAAGDTELAVTEAGATQSSPHALTYIALGVAALGLALGAAGFRAARR